MARVNWRRCVSIGIFLFKQGDLHSANAKFFIVTSNQALQLSDQIVPHIFHYGLS